MQAEVENLRKVYNEEHSRPIPPGSSEKVWKEVQNRLKQDCRTGRAEFIISHLLRRPAGPKSWNVNPEEWITSDEIDAIEKELMGDDGSAFQNDPEIQKAIADAKAAAGGAKANQEFAPE